MDEDDVDSWYDEQKDLALSRYLEERGNNKKKEGAEEKYKRELKLLRKKYEVMYDRCVKRQKQKEFLLNKMEKIKKTFLQLLSRVKK